MQLFQKPLDLLYWREVRGSTELFPGSAGLETHFSFHTKGRHTEGLMLHTSTPHISHLSLPTSGLLCFPRFLHPKVARGHASLELCPERESRFLPTVWEAHIANLSLELKREQGKATEHQKYTGGVCCLQCPTAQSCFSEPFWGM